LNLLSAVASSKIRAFSFGIRAFSFGGGVQSMAVLVLQAQGKLPEAYDAFVFANVGEDSENPATLAYVENVAKPFAEKHGIKFIEVQKRRRNGELDTLYQFVHREKNSVSLPIRMANGAPGNRNCTGTFKINVIDRWIKKAGYSHSIIGIGISTDEFLRARDEQWHASDYGVQKRREHPLITLRLNRAQCQQIIQEAGLPLPPKSACWWCPFKKRTEWIELRRTDPPLFWKAVYLEQYINAKRALMGRDRVYFHPSLKPLDQATGQQLALFTEYEMDACESGYCMV
jgi:3'-phosphoadenosine 5'-phosphosulfate sulfotransferase (PAPS reductase)/FAD synthetase